MAKIRILVKPTQQGDYVVKGEALVGTYLARILIPYRLVETSTGKVLEEDYLGIEYKGKSKLTDEKVQKIVQLLQRYFSNPRVRFEIAGKPVVENIQRVVTNIIPIQTIAIEEKPNGELIVQNILTGKKYAYQLPRTFKLHIKNPTNLVTGLAILLGVAGENLHTYPREGYILYVIDIPRWLEYVRNIRQRAETFEQDIEQGRLRIPPIYLKNRKLMKALEKLEQIGVPLKAIVEGRKRTINV